MSQPAQTVDELLASAAQAYAAGELPSAARFAQDALTVDPQSAFACNILGLAAFAGGDAAGAVAHLRRAATLGAGSAEYANNLGVVLHALGDMEAARPALEQALSLDPHFAQAANNLGSVLEKLGDAGGAIARYWQALAIDPVYVEARDNLASACARVAPPWHFPMLGDRIRNAAYAQALERVAPGRRVLDIGAGTGLLAMMAARAGAAEVTTCEMQPVIAALAAGIVEGNGLADRVAVHPLKSDQLQVGRELAGPADVLVTETFSSSLLSEHVLPTVEDAHLRLLSPEAVVIPRRAAAIGRLIGGEVIEDHLFAASWEGFELSLFDALAPVKLGLHLDRVPHQALSDEFEIFGFDLLRPPFPPERRRLEVEATAAGRCVGVAQWIRLDLDETTTYENRPTPGAGANGWMHVVYRFARPVEVWPGDRVPLLVGHNRAEIVVALDPSSSSAAPDVCVQGS